MLDQRKAIEFKNITKDFPGVKALDDVSFEVKKGEVHGLVGENGAGKSTLLNILHGIYNEYRGDFKINGELKNYQDAKQALNDGIVKVHQEVSMVPELTVGQNITLGYEETKGLFVKTANTHKTVNEILDSLDCSFRSQDLAVQLSIGEMQMASIAKAIYHKAKIISFDEPTASLSLREKNSFFEVIRQLKEQGITMIYISHHLDEIFEVCDSLTILRDGKVVDSVSVKETNKNELIRKMVGREIKQLAYKNNQAIQNEVVLEVDQLTVPDVFSDVSFNLKRGEILGFAGLVGSKRTDVMLTLIGALNKSSGSVKLFNKEVNIKAPYQAVQLGIGLVPENRKTQGFNKYFDNSFNIGLTKMDKFLKSSFIRDKSMRENARSQGHALNLKPNDPYYHTVNLSGGNQQKIVIAKWLSADVDILILDEPTKGVDVGAKSEIYQILNEFVKKGKSIIIVSSELPEVLGLSDRIIVMREGKIVQELVNNQLTEQDIMFYAMGVKNNEHIL